LIILLGNQVTKVICVAVCRWIKGPRYSFVLLLHIGSCWLLQLLVGLGKENELQEGKELVMPQWLKGIGKGLST
jgi:hypothetical protein